MGAFALLDSSLLYLIAWLSPWVIDIPFALGIRLGRNIKLQELLQLLGFSIIIGIVIRAFNPYWVGALLLITIVYELYKGKWLELTYTLCIAVPWLFLNHGYMGPSPIPVLFAACILVRHYGNIEFPKEEMEAHASSFAAGLIPGYSAVRVSVDNRNEAFSEMIALSTIAFTRKTGITVLSERISDLIDPGHWPWLILPLIAGISLGSYIPPLKKRIIKFPRVASAIVILALCLFRIELPMMCLACMAGAVLAYVHKGPQYLIIFTILSSLVF